MNINYKEAQFDFLNNAALSSQDPRGPRVLSAQLVLSLENLVILMIMSIMLMIFCFSIGVERGRKTALLDGNSSSIADEAPAPSAASKASTAQETSVADEKPVAGVWGSAVALFKGKPDAVDQESAASTEVKARAVVAAKPAVTTSVAAVKSPAKAEQSASATNAAKPAGSDTFTVQVASYKTQKFAQIEADKLKQKGYRDIHVLPKGSYVIVCIGKFTNKSDATAYTNKLKDRYQSPYVRRL